MVYRPAPTPDGLVRWCQHLVLDAVVENLVAGLRVFRQNLDRNQEVTGINVNGGPVGVFDLEERPAERGMNTEPLSVPAKILHRDGEPGVPLGRQPELAFFQQSHCA